MSMEANRRQSLRIEAYLPCWFKKIHPSEIQRVRCDISDAAVMRRFRSVICDNKDADLNKVLERIEKLEDRVEALFDQIQSRHEKPMVRSRCVFNSNGGEFDLISVEKEWKVDDLAEIRFVLPHRRHEEIITLGRLIRWKQQASPAEEAPAEAVPGAVPPDAPARMPSLIFAFIDLSSDQEELITRYLLQRQREDMRSLRSS